MSEIIPADAIVIEHGAPEFLSQGRTVAAGRGWDWIASGYALFMKEPIIWIVLGVLFAAFFMLVGSVVFLGGLAVTVLSPVLVAGIMIGCGELERGRRLEINHFIAGFKKNTSSLLVLGLIVSVALMVALIPSMLVVGFAGAMSLITGHLSTLLGLGVLATLLASAFYLALSLPVYMAAWYAPVLIVLHGMTPASALKASFVACLKNMLPFFLYGVVLIVLGVVAAIPAGLGLLVLIPVTLASVYTSYRDIFFSA